MEIRIVVLALSLQDAFKSNWMVSRPANPGMYLHICRAVSFDFDFSMVKKGLLGTSFPFRPYLPLFAPIPPRSTA